MRRGKEQGSEGPSAYQRFQAAMAKVREHLAAAREGKADRRTPQHLIDEVNSASDDLRSSRDQ